MKRKTPTVLRSEPVLEGLYFPEGTRWHDGKLWFGEIQAARASWLDPEGGAVVAAQFDSPCSGLGFLPDGSLVASLMKERQLVRTVGGETSVHADLRDLPFDHINDLVADGRGRIYVDALAYHMHWEQPTELADGTIFHGFENHAGHTPLAVTDSLVLVDEDGSARIVATGMLGPNGLAITADGKKLIVAEWRADRLTQYPIEPDGSLGAPTLYGETSGLPDGLYMDAEDAVWCASPQAGNCVRMVAGGEVDVVVEPTAGTRVTACALGGPELRTLYLTTDRHPTLGGGFIEAVEVEVPGISA